MIRSVKIENFKSICNLEMDLGRVTVLIGANGSGKSNILEAIGIASAVAADKLDNEFLASRGIRMPNDPRMILSAFRSQDIPTHATVLIDGCEFGLQLPEWDLTGEAELAFLPFIKPRTDSDEIIYAPANMATVFAEPLKTLDLSSNEAAGKLFALIVFLAVHKINQQQWQKLIDEQSVGEEAKQLMLNIRTLQRFLIYAPENRELRTFAEEGQILPLGIRGEGLFRLLKIMANQDDGAKLALLKEKLQLIDWFEDFEFQNDAVAYERSLRIKDRHLSDDLAYIDQRSANEGFLYLLFYFALLISDATPTFFAIDNIDASLNPKLCERLIQEMVELAKANDKQFIVTTHNPAILDGLNLHDDEQRLYSVRRNRNGETRADRIEAPKVEEGQTPVRLSEAYLRGYLGGLPTNF